VARRQTPDFNAPSLFDGPGGFDAPASAPAGGAPPKDERPPLLLLMDGHAMLFRAWFALAQARPMTTRTTGEDVRGVYSFTATFFKVLAEHRPTHVIIAFDPRGPTFRHDAFEAYKAHRPEAPEGLVQNVERAKQVMEAFTVPVLIKDGFEADDVIGTIARQASEAGVDTLIVTGDTDTLQLVGPRTRVLLTTGYGNNKVYDVEAVRERYEGLDPDQQRDLKALTGDTSDNVPGVPGIGAKTAVKLITQFGSVESLLDRVDEVTPPRIQGLVREHAAQARESKHLVTIDTHAPVTLDLEAARFGGFQRDDVLALFRELEFSSLVPRIPIPPGEGPAPAVTADAPAPEPAGEVDTRIVDTAEGLAALAKELAGAESFALEVLPSGPRPIEAQAVGIALATGPGAAAYVPIAHAEGRTLPAADVVAALRPVLESGKAQVVGHNLNPAITLLTAQGLEPTRVAVAYDTYLAAHLAGEKSLGLKALAFTRLARELEEVTALTGTGRKQRPLAEVPIAEAAAWAGAALDAVLALRAALGEDLEREELSGYLTEHSLPLVPVLVRMQANGIAVDTGVLTELAAELAEGVASEERGAYEAVGHEFAINSPGQLGDLLFRQLGLPAGKRTQTGYSTDASILEGLLKQADEGLLEGDADQQKGLEVIRHVLRYRELSKLKSTYVDTLPTQVNPRTGRVHTCYNQAGSATGRLASNDPNLQNIPVRTEMGLRVRKAFIAAERPAWTLVSADYSQIDLRALAHLSGDGAMRAAFERGEDIHASTASLIYKVPLGEVTRDMRRLAKVMNFGVTYGLSAFGISQQTELTREEGAAFIEQYFATYPRVREFLDETVAQARECGYVETLLGRRRYLPELNASAFPVRQGAERMALNMPVQGTSADIINAAMVRVQRRLEADGFAARMLLQVHDELVFEAPRAEVGTLSGMLRKEMPAALELAVPLAVEVKTGDDWASLDVQEDENVQAEADA
jgi:DNA polymerase-1